MNFEKAINIAEDPIINIWLEKWLVKCILALAKKLDIAKKEIGKIE